MLELGEYKKYENSVLQSASSKWLEWIKKRYNVIIYTRYAVGFIVMMPSMTAGEGSDWNFW